MRFSDFERLEFLSEKIGFKKLNTYLWNHYSYLFESNFQYLFELYTETGSYIEPYADKEYEWEKQVKWLERFIKNMPDEKVRAWIQGSISQNH